MTAWLSVIGIGEDGLDGVTPAARHLIEGAEVLVGGRRHLDMVRHGPAERLTWATPLSTTIKAIKARRGKRLAVLATGDPMWFGIGVTLARHFTMTEMTIIPSLSAFSLAAARLGWPLAQVETITLHGRPLELVVPVLAPAARLLMLSADGGTPAQVAALLRERGWGPSRLAVLEHLGGSEERRVDGIAADWGDTRAADLNLIAVECVPAPGTPIVPRVPGLPDDVFEHDGQLTKREVRAATLAALAPLPGQLLWDVGAGAGSIAIEWMRAARDAAAIAIEHDPSRAAMIAHNAARLGVPRLKVVKGSAPEALAGLPAPDAVFIGGGISTTGLIEHAWRALTPRGRLVANVVTMEGERALFDWQGRIGGSLTRLAITRAEPIGERLGWRPLAPVTQWAVTKGSDPS